MISRGGAPRSAKRAAVALRRPGQNNAAVRPDYTSHEIFLQTPADRKRLPTFSHEKCKVPRRRFRNYLQQVGVHGNINIDRISVLFVCLAILQPSVSQVLGTEAYNVFSEAGRV